MEAWERDQLVSRIVAARTRYRLGDRAVVVAWPGRDARAMAADVYADTYREADLRGIPAADEAVLRLIERGVLSPVDHERLGKIPGLVDDLKVSLWEGWARSDARDAIRKGIDGLRREADRIGLVQHSHSHATRESAAMAARARFLTGCSILLGGDEPYWADPLLDWERPDGIVDAVLERMARDRPGEAEFRELARTEPWRSTWESAKHAGRGVFDAASCDLSDDQRALVRWSSHYDAIHAHPSRPADSVIDDDDALDGWLIVQRRKREADSARGLLDGIRSDKIKNADEVYIVARGAEGVAEVERLNDPLAAATKKQRMGHLKNKGRAGELEMPDTRMRLQMEAQRKFTNTIKGH